MVKKSNDYLIIGFALFAMFFGAGNLIFPPSLGRAVGSGYISASAGFLITGVGLPLLGIISSMKSGGSFEMMADKVGKWFSILVTTALILSIGPMLAIPRTAATTFELSLQPLFPNITPFWGILGYLLINLFFVFKPNSIIDTIGKILTPILLIMLFLIVAKGFLKPIGPIIDTGYSNIFTKSLLEGYQTMDAMASVIFASIIISSVKSKGYTSEKEIISTTIASSLIAVLGLSIVYGGLLYLGAQTSSLYGIFIPRTKLVMEISKSVLGSFGTIALSVAVGLACLTTSIGLTATGANFFAKLSKGKLSYKVNVVLITLLSFIIAIKGVDSIIAFAAPILQILYPVVIILILTNLLGSLIKNNKVISVTVYTALFISILNTLEGLINSPFIAKLLGFIPFSEVGFSWALPSIIAFIISLILFNNSSSPKEATNYNK